MGGRPGDMGPLAAVQHQSVLCGLSPATAARDEQCGVILAQDTAAAALGLGEAAGEPGTPCLWLHTLEPAVKAPALKEGLHSPRPPPGAASLSTGHSSCCRWRIWHSEAFHAPAFPTCFSA